MSLKSLLVVLLVAVLLFGVVGAANAQESKGNSQAQNGMPSVAEVVVQSNQQVERNENQNGVSQGNAVQQQRQEGPCGPMCQRNSVEPVEPIEPPVIPPPERKPIQPPTVITVTNVITVVQIVTVTVEVEAPCPIQFCPRCEVNFHEASCPDYAPESAPVYTCGVYHMPEPEAAEEVAEIPFWVYCTIGLACLMAGAAVFYLDRKGA